jgi:hypothetical protein
MDDIDYEKWAFAMCSLLDAIELNADNEEKVRELVGGRFELAEQFGMRIVWGGPAASTQ